MKRRCSPLCSIGLFVGLALLLLSFVLQARETGVSNPINNAIGGYVPRTIAGRTFGRPQGGGR